MCPLSCGGAEIGTMFDLSPVTDYLDIDKDAQDHVIRGAIRLEGVVNSKSPCCFESVKFIQPDTPLTLSQSSCYPSGRFCFCTVVDCVTGIDGLISESDMGDKDWQDPNEVSELIRRAKGRVCKR